MVVAISAVHSSFLFGAVASPASKIFLTHDRVGQGVKWQATYFLATISVLYSLSKVMWFDNFLIAYAVHEAILHSVYLAMANKVVTGIK